jgi:YHS domain-containing protein
MRIALASFVVLLSLACTRTEAPVAPTVAQPELTAVAAPAEASCGDGAACGEEKQAGSCGAHADPHHVATAQVAFEAAPAHGDKALCLVMNREFVVDDRTTTSVFEGKTYAFCCDGCKQVFDENPTKFVRADVKPHTDAKPDEKSKS